MINTYMTDVSNFDWPSFYCGLACIAAKLFCGQDLMGQVGFNLPGVSVN